MKNNGNRYCKVCGSKLQKRGKHRNGSQRWLCIKCKKSFTLDRPDVVNKAIEHKFNNWILNQATKTEKGIRNSTFWRHSKYLLHRSVEPVTTGEQYEVIIIDGKWIEDEICLIARTPKYVIDWIWVQYENQETWSELLHDIHPPKYVVCDGLNGMLLAISKLWPSTIVQRCLFHMWLNSRQKLTLHPLTMAGDILLSISRNLLQIRTMDDFKKWSENLHQWYIKYKDFMNEKTLRDESTRQKYQRKWWYTHKNIRSVFKSFIKLLKNKTLYNFVREKQIKVPYTSNYLEGGINNRIQTLVSCHRGLTKYQKRQMVDIYLLSRTKFGEKK